MSEKLPAIKSRIVIKILKKIGFKERRQTGSHLILRHPETNKIVPIPIHTKGIKKGTLMSILKQANLTKQGFIQLSKGRKIAKN